MEHFFAHAEKPFWLEEVTSLFPPIDLNVGLGVVGVVGVNKATDDRLRTRLFLDVKRRSSGGFAAFWFTLLCPSDIGGKTSSLTLRFLGEII